MPKAPTNDKRCSQKLMIPEGIIPTVTLKSLAFVVERQGTLANICRPSVVHLRDQIGIQAPDYGAYRLNMQSLLSYISYRLADVQW